jgi:hypothetical protein
MRSSSGICQTREQLTAKQALIVDFGECGECSRDAKTVPLCESAFLDPPGAPGGQRSLVFARQPGSGKIDKWSRPCSLCSHPVSRWRHLTSSPILHQRGCVLRRHPIPLRSTRLLTVYTQLHQEDRGGFKLFLFILIFFEQSRERHIHSGPSRCEHLHTFTFT